MGWIRHHGIVVTSCIDTLLKAAHEQAMSIFPPDSVTSIAEGVTNGYATFLVAPDGSKEGWPESDTGDARRDAFVQWLSEQAYSDGSNSLSWLEYEHDTDNKTNRVVRAAGQAPYGIKIEE